MATIALEGMIFYAYHGVHQAEQELGARFEVDVKLEANIAQAAESDKLSQTIDYALVYNIIAEEMRQPRRLLETHVLGIAQRLLNAFPPIQTVEIALHKHDPPLGGLCRRASVIESVKR